MSFSLHRPFSFNNTRKIKGVNIEGKEPLNGDILSFNGRYWEVTTPIGTTGPTGATGPTGPVTSGTKSGQALNWNSASNTWQITGDINLAFGNDAGQNAQGKNAIAIGNEAGTSSQFPHAIAIGSRAGQNSQSPHAIAIGNEAGNDNQKDKAIAIGLQAGQNAQCQHAIAIGNEAGINMQQDNAIAIGYSAGSHGQYFNSIAIGKEAGSNNQGTNSIAIGYAAGLEQYDSSIIINASGGELNSYTQGFYVKPIREQTNNKVLLYNETSGEITYAELSDIIS